MDGLDIIRYDDKQLQKVSNTIALTNKLLALVKPQLIPYRKRGKWGFCTPEKQIVIDCVYDNVFEFNESLAGIQRGSYWGFCNSSGVEVIACIYDEVYSMVNGLALVKKRGLWGFINRNGNND